VLTADAKSYAIFRGGRKTAARDSFKPA
jgi:hypothetical protein